MKKMTAAVCVVLLIGCLCSCGKRQGADGPSEAAATEPAVTQAASTTAAPAVTQADSSPAEPAFRLDSLPDIGAYTPDSLRYYYGKPLNEFRTADDYGAVIPYVLRQESVKVGDGPDVFDCGFMTTDGRVVTGPIYDRVWQESVDGQTYYRAERKLLVAASEVPEYRQDMTEEEWEAYDAAYRKTQMYVIENRVCQIISGDGSRCGSFSGVARFYTDGSSGKTVIVNDGYADGHRTLKIYDMDFRLMIDLSRPLRWFLDDYSFFGADITGYHLIGADDTGVAVAVTWSEEDESHVWRGMTKVYLTDGDAIANAVDIKDAYAKAVFGNQIVTDRGLFALDGSRQTDSTGEYVFFAGNLYFFDSQAGRLIRRDRNGNQTPVGGLRADSPHVQNVRTDDGAGYLLVAGNTDETDEYAVFDDDLREVYRIAGEQDAELFLCVGYGQETGFFCLVKNGVTELRGWDGGLLAEVPVALAPKSYSSVSNLQELESGDGGSYLYNPKSGTVIVIPPERLKDGQLVYCDEKWYVIRVYEENYSDYQETLYDANTHEPVIEDLRAFKSVTVDGKPYYAYVDGAVAYVRDGTGRVLLRTHAGAMA